MKTNVEIKTPFRLTDKAREKNGKVSVHEIISNANGNINVVAFARGAMFARHQVAADVLAYVIEGEVEFEIDDTRYKLVKGDAIVLPADTPHTVLGLDSSRVLLCRINA